MSDKIKTPISELMEQAMKNYEQALQSGLKLQEESSKWWSEVMASSATPVDWQKRWKSTANQMIPIVQKRMEDSLRLLEQSSRTSLDLLKQAVSVTATDSATNVQGKLQELWEGSLEAMRHNAQAVAQANAKVVESWMQLFAAGTDTGAAKTKAG